MRLVEYNVPVYHSMQVFSYLEVIHHWQQEDLDLVLFLDDELYKSLNTQQYLCATDLPNNISVCNVQVQASHLQNNYGMLLNNEDLQSYLTYCFSSHSRERTGFVHNGVVYRFYTLW